MIDLIKKSFNALILAVFLIATSSAACTDEAQFELSHYVSHSKLNQNTLELVDAVFLRDAEAAKALLECCHDIKVNARLRDGMTILHIASKLGDLPMVNLFLEQGCFKVNLKTVPDGFTPYDIALQEGHLDVVLALQDNDTFDFEATAYSEVLNRSIRTSVNEVKPVAVEKIKQHAKKKTRKKFNRNDYVDKELPSKRSLEDELFRVVQSTNYLDKTAVIGALFKSGADVNVLSDKYSNSTLILAPLHLASITGDWCAVKALLLHPDIKVNARSKDPEASKYGHDTGLTALHYASQFGHERVLKLLLGDRRCKPLTKTQGKNLTAFNIANTSKIRKIEAIFRHSKRKYKASAPVRVVAAQAVRNPGGEPSASSSAGSAASSGRASRATQSSGGGAAASSRRPSRAVQGSGAETVPQSLKSRPYKCDKCGKRYASRRSLQGHEDYEHDDRSVVCEICKKTLQNKRKLFNHQRSCNNNKKEYVCSFVGCSKRFKGKYGLQSHVYQAHYKTRFQCSSCPTNYASNYSLKKHLLSIHGRGFLYPCSICPNFAFDDKKLLDEHNVNKGHC